MKLSAAVVVLVSVAGLSQAPQFHSGVQLITLNVSVLDKSGNAVTDLRPSDFSVLVDGKPRVVRFAQLFHSERSPIVVSSDHSLGRYATNTDAPTGHVVVFAIDRYALPPGTERPILTSAAGMLDRLSLADSVGLVNIPGTTIDVTRDHPLIARALESIVGMSQPGMSQRSVTWPEAKAIDAGDNLVLAQVVERECLSPDDSYCQQDIHTAVRETLGYGREHADMVLASLTSIVNHLAVIRAPKHIVLLSAGLPFDTEFLDRFKAVERAAAQSHVTIDTIRVHTFAADATSPVKGGVAPEGTADRAGLDTLASLTGGTAFLASGRDTGIFTRLISQVTTFYQLGVESSASDASDRLHDVRVRVNRSGVDVLAPPRVVVAPAERAPTVLTDALQQPTDVAAVPIGVSIYSMLTEAGAPQTLVAAAIGEPDKPAPAEWGAAVMRDGTPVATTRGAMPAGPERPQIVATSFNLPPGPYRVRVAAVDAAGGIGALDVPFTSGGYRLSASTLASDLMLGVTSGNQLEPRRRVAVTDELTALVQISAANAADLTGTIEFVRGGTAAAAVAVPLVRASSGDSARLSLQAVLAPGALPPGSYTAIAAIRSGSEAIGHISRVVEITPANTPSAPASSPASPAERVRPAADAAAIMARVASYVERYGEAASVLIGVERYTQKATEAEVMGGGSARMSARGRPGGSARVSEQTTIRRLTSELALVRNTAAIGGWIAFRDVMEVDGKRVADRGDRLRSIFESMAPDIDAARRIDEENARFNIGPVKRTFNVPTATLLFFTPANLPRFSFKSNGTDQMDGSTVLVVDFRETGRPTLVTTSKRQDIPASGTLWVDPTDGHVVKTRLTLSGFAGSQSTAVLEVTYRRHTALEMWVPASMSESDATAAGTVVGTAEYDDFRRFQTSVRIK